MTALTSSKFSLDAFHRQWAQSRSRWLDFELSKTFLEVQKIVREGWEHGWWDNDDEIGERLDIKRNMAMRIRNGNYDDVGRTTIFWLARAFGIPECGSWLGSGGKRRQLLEDMLPLFIEMELLASAVDADEVNTLIEKMGRIDWESRTDSTAFHRWLAEQERHWFSGHEALALRAAGLWLVLRPMLQSYPDFLLCCARVKLAPEEYPEFQADVEIVGKMRRVARNALRKCAKPLAKASNDKEKTEIFAEEMSKDLRHLLKKRKNPALGLLQIYQLALDDLLTLTHGELLEKSERIRNASKTFFT